MFKVEVVIEGFEDLMQFIQLVNGLNVEKVKALTVSLNESTNKLKEAEKKDKQSNVSTGSS